MPKILSPYPAVFLTPCHSLFLDHPSSCSVSIGAPMRLHVDRLAPIIGAHWTEAAAQWDALRGQAFTSDFVGMSDGGDA